MNYRIKPLKMVLVCFFSILFLSSCNMLPQEEEVLAPPLVKQPEIKYETQEVVKEDLADVIHGAGVFVPIQEESVFFTNTSGRLKVIHVKNNQEVKKGDLLVELYNEELVNEIKIQEINVEKSKLNYESNKNAVNNKDDLRIKEIDLELAKQKLKDLKNRSSFEALQTEIKQQELEVERRQILFDQLKQKVLNGDQSLINAELDYKLQKLKLDQLQQKLIASKLTAPVDGRVVYVNSKVKQGDFIESYEELVRIADCNKIELEYDGSYINDFKQGMEVRVEYKNFSLQGEVAYAPSGTSSNTNEDKRHVLIEVNNMPNDVSIGERASLYLTLDERKNVIVVPRSAVNNYLGRNYVNILDDGLKKEQDIEIGLETTSKVEVINGLKEGDLIIVR